MTKSNYFSHFNNDKSRPLSANGMLMYWWHGVIQDEKYWAGCKDSDVSNEHLGIHYSQKPEENPKKGWGKRYKVAICGRHPAIKIDKDEADVLEMAEVLYPVTAGSGLGGTRQTAALRQGTHVVGFYADGKEGREPIILGCFGVNEQNEPYIVQGDTDRYFDLRTANKGQCGSKPISEKDKSLEKGTPALESNCNPNVASVCKKTQRQDGDSVDLLKPPKRCEGPADLISNIKSLLGTLTKAINLAKQGASDLVSSISGTLKSITRQISGLTNTLMDRMSGYLGNVINGAISGLMNNLPPFSRMGLNNVAQGALTGLGCAFNKIKDGMFGIVKDLTKQFVDNYISAPLCAASSYVGSLMGNVIGEVNGAIDTAVGEINKILGIGTGFADKALDVLDFALDILDVFSCDNDTGKCPETNQWSIWNGPREFQSRVEEGASRIVNDILREVETVLPGSEAGAAANPCKSRQVPCGPPKLQIHGGGSKSTGNLVISATGKVLGVDFSVLGSEYTSPPQFRVVDSCGLGGGAQIEGIMEPTGKVNEFKEPLYALTGAVVLDTGSQYTPFFNGMSGGNEFIFSLPSDTIHFKTGSTQTINGREVNGTGYEVYPCGTTINLTEGDQIYLPSGTISELFDEEGNVVQTLEGLGHEDFILVEFDGSITTPCNPENEVMVPTIEYTLEAGETIDPEEEFVIESPESSQSLPIEETETFVEIPSPEVSFQPQTVPGVIFTEGDIISPKYTSPSSAAVFSSSYETNGTSRIQPLIIEDFLPGTYPVVPTIERVIIKNSGYGYTYNDILTISENKGAELEFVINDKGEVTEITVLRGGIGFNDVPNIQIQSETGYNFEAVAVLKFVYAYEVDLTDVEIPEGSQVLNVLDIVNKYPKEEEINDGNGDGTSDVIDFGTDGNGDGTSDVIDFGTDGNGDGTSDVIDFGTDGNGDVTEFNPDVIN